MWSYEYMASLPKATRDLAEKWASTLTADDAVDVELVNDLWLEYAGEATGADSVRFTWQG